MLLTLILLHALGPRDGNQRGLKEIQHGSTEGPKNIYLHVRTLLILNIFDGHYSNLDSRGLTSIGFKESTEKKSMKEKQAFKSDKIKYVREALVWMRFLELNKTNRESRTNKKTTRPQLFKRWIALPTG